MRVFVSGAGGFIGSHVVEALVRRGDEVKALVRYTSSGGSNWLETLEPDLLEQVEIVRGDVRDGEFLLESSRGCEAFLHLAALIAIPYSYHAPRSYIDTNVGGTLNALQCSRTHGCRLAVVSTSEVYGTAQQIPIREDHPLSAQSPYAASKIAADQLALSFQRSFETQVSVVRPFNTYGPRQSARAVIPTILSQVLAGKETIHLGSLTPTRDLCYVADTAEGIIKVGLHPDAVGRVIQLGTGREISIGELACLLAKICGRDVKIEQDEKRIRPAKSEVERLLSDPSEAETLCTWRSRLSLEEGLERTVRWFEQNIHRYQADQYGL